MDLAAARGILQGMFDRKMALANAERFSTHSRMVADRHRAEATAIAMVLASLSEKAS